MLIQKKRGTLFYAHFSIEVLAKPITKNEQQSPRRIYLLPIHLGTLSRGIDAPSMHGGNTIPVAFITLSFGVKEKIARFRLPKRTLTNAYLICHHPANRANTEETLPSHPSAWVLFLYLRPRRTINTITTQRQTRLNR